MPDLTESMLSDALSRLGRSGFPDDATDVRSVARPGPAYEDQPPLGPRRPASLLVAMAACVALLIGIGVASRRSDTPAPSVAEPGTTAETLPAAPIDGRYDHVAVRVDDVVMVWGGRAVPPSQDASSASEEVWDDGATFDLTSRIWREVETSPLEARHSALAAAIDGRVAIVGGRATGAVFRNGALYDPTADSWAPLPELPTCPATLTSVDDVLVVTGRCGQEGSISILRYDAELDRWVTGAPTPLTEISQTTSSSGLLVAWDELTDRMATYDPMADRWSEPSGPVLAGASEQIDGTVLIPRDNGEVVLVASVTDADRTTAQTATYAVAEGWGAMQVIDIETPAAEAGPAVIAEGRAIWATSRGLAWLDDDGSLGEFDEAARELSRSPLVPAAPVADIFVWGGVDLEGELRSDGSLLTVG